jgi:hypothetical protein
MRENSSSVVIGTAHVVAATLAQQLAVEFRQSTAANGAKEHRLLVVGNPSFRTALNFG